MIDYIIAPNLLLPLSLLLLLVVFGSKITGRANTPFYIFVHIFSTPCGWDLSGVRLYFYIKCFIRYRIFPPTVHVRKPVDWSFTSSQVISSIFILWWKTARPGISVTVTTHIWSPKGLFSFHVKSRWAYFLSVCKSPWQSWCLKNFPLFFRLSLNQGNEPDEWEALLNNRLIMAKGRRVKLNRTSEGMKTKESLFRMNSQFCQLW